MAEKKRGTLVMPFLTVKNPPASWGASKAKTQNRVVLLDVDI